MPFFNKKASEKKKGSEKISSKYNVKEVLGS